MAILLALPGCVPKAEEPEPMPAVDLGGAGQGNELGPQPITKPAKRIETH